MKIDLPRMSAERPAPGVERRRVTGARLELIAYRYDPGATFPRHQHEAEQLTIVRSGMLVFRFDDEDVHLEAGQALLIDARRPHGAFVPADAGVTETFNVFTPVRERPPES